MAELVNPTHTSALSSRNAEPSHLGGVNYDDLGGPTWDHAGGPDVYKIDASRGVSTDTTIPKSVSAEPSHLKSEDLDDLDVVFDGDGDADDLDGLDAELDSFDSLDPVDIDLTLDEEDEDEKKNPFAEEDDKEDDKVVKEEDEEDGDKKKNPFAEEDDKKKNPFAEEDDKDKDDKNPFAEEDDKDDDKVVKESDDEDEDDKVVKEEDEDKTDDKEKVEESVKIRITMPKTALFESVNMSAKTQKKVAVVFESAVRQTTKQVATQLHRHYKALTESRIAKRDAVLGKQIDTYLAYVVEEWVKANKVTIRESLRTQLAEEFLDGLKGLFKEHWIDVPESKVDVVQKLTEQNKRLSRQLNESHASRLKLRTLAERANKARIVSEFTRGMSEASSAKMLKLAEDTSYTTAKDFREKLNLLKESYFPEQKPSLKRLVTEDVQDPTSRKNTTAGTDPDIRAIADVLSRQAKSDKW
jgi:hypothetical protein